MKSQRDERQQVVLHFQGMLDSESHPINGNGKSENSGLTELLLRHSDIIKIKRSKIRGIKKNNVILEQETDRVATRSNDKSLAKLRPLT